jgi:hypothetical protein
MGMKTSTAPLVFRDKESGYFFYTFDYNWSVYRSPQGYKTQAEAANAAKQHFCAITGACSKA